MHIKKYCMGPKTLQCGEIIGDELCGILVNRGGANICGNFL